MTTEKDIEDRIREHYCAENGEWLVEKGKVKEARLLKEAFNRIHSLKNDARMYGNWYHDERYKRISLEKDLEQREKNLVARETHFARELERFKDLISNWQK